jgi:putative two-component system hydrogenase maturation factor HypX/HoxX
MRILLLTHSFNSLAQRLFVELRARGHHVSVELDIADAVTVEAVALFRPDLLIAPFLKRAIPESVWGSTRCLIVHPGIQGDRGPSSLDWAILEREPDWGVTVLEANAEMDAGDVWASEPFPMRDASKSSLYRNEVAGAALAAVLRALERFGAPGWPKPQAATDPPARGRFRPAMRQEVRSIDWARDDTATIRAKCAASDGSPGVLDALFGRPCHLFDVHTVSAGTLGIVRAHWPAAAPGDVLARRDGAVLRRTRDGALWIGHARPAWENAQGGPPFKRAVVHLFRDQAAALPDLPMPLMRADDEWGELRYREQDGVGTVEFDFYNGAMSTLQCARLREAVAFAKTRAIRVLVLAGGTDFFSNGIDLTEIEAAYSPADESMRNIEAIDDLVLEILTATHVLTVSALRGNAGAGGSFLALAADEVWAHPGVLLNLHYKNMGNLYGSEYWTYTLPNRVGAVAAKSIVQGRLPLSVPQAAAQGLVDGVFGASAQDFAVQLQTRAHALARDPQFAQRLEQKAARRAADEATKPLARYREEELARMQRNFYGFDTSYHIARYHFVRKIPHAWTPRHLAVHRDVAANLIAARSAATA